MIPKITEIHRTNDLQSEIAHRSPRNKIYRKPDNNRARQGDDKRVKSRPNEFLGFYSPKHQQNIQGSLEVYQLNSFESINSRTLKNQRSLNNLKRGECSITKIQQDITLNKENSGSSHSERSHRSRKQTQLQLKLKALTYQNSRLKTDNKILIEENELLRKQIENPVFSTTSSISFSRSIGKSDGNQKVNQLMLTIQSLESQIKILKNKIFDLERTVKSQRDLELYLDSLENIGKEQREEIFKLEKTNKYLEIEVRTLKKQKIMGEATRKMQSDYAQAEADNRRLRRIVLDLQTRLKNTMLFDLTPDVSEKNESFLLD